MRSTNPRWPPVRPRSGGHEATREILRAGVVHRAFEALPPRRIEHGDGKAGAAGLFDGSRLGGLSLEEAASQFRDVHHAVVGCAYGKRDLHWIPAAGHLMAGAIAKINPVAAVEMDAELHTVVRLFENHQLRHALEKGKHDAR